MTPAGDEIKGECNQIGISSMQYSSVRMNPANYFAKKIGEHRPHSRKYSDPSADDPRKHPTRNLRRARLMLAAETTHKSRLAATLAVGTQVEAWPQPSRTRRNGIRYGCDVQERCRARSRVRFEPAGHSFVFGRIINGLEPFHCALGLAPLKSLYRLATPVCWMPIQRLHMTILPG
jgi:hypothetical protein